MKRHSADEIDEMLRSGARTARRDPSPALRARVVAALASEPPGSGSGSANRARTDRPAWRERWQDTLVAASVLLAVGLWVFALVGVLGGGPGTARFAADPGSPARWTDGLFAIADADAGGAPGALAGIARAPQTLRTAVDDSLFAELDRIGQDARQAARFLVGRLPASLVLRPGEDGPH